MCCLPKWISHCRKYTHAVYICIEHFPLSDLPTIPSDLKIQIERGKIVLSWNMPVGFFTALAVEECRRKQQDCKMYHLAINATSLELKAVDDATYKLVIYQHHQEVAKSGVFQEEFPFAGKEY